MIALVEELQEKVKETVAKDIFEDLVNRYSEAEMARVDLEERCVSLESLITQSPENASPKAAEEEKTAEAYERYRKHMKTFSSFSDRPSVKDLKPVCSKSTNLYAYLAQDKNAKSFVHHVLYLPKRVNPTSDFQFIAFGPSHRYDHRTKNWINGSDLERFHGETRELFITWNSLVLYVGTYKCHDLRPLCPEGTHNPVHISASEMIDAALGIPRPKNFLNIIKQCYPDGRIRVVATGLHCVGFNQALYDSLRKRFATDNKTEGKRKADDDGGSEGTEPKRRK
ncbi:hypothetical protein B0H15DRAFT_441058 [Mycena belliarum]|uniref:Uncharacterized protein n=1 Tax=Mycena belliarum TaxID=1033014 RepID=A0AAD6TX57_9AGAR|nr:hypothetical protein B0H15DRAFT_441058 [Mycena belliae]